MFSKFFAKYFFTMPFILMTGGVPIYDPWGVCVCKILQIIYDKGEIYLAEYGLSPQAYILQSDAHLKIRQEKSPEVFQLHEHRELPLEGVYIRISSPGLQS